MSPAVALVCEVCGKAGQLDPRDAEALLRRSSDGVPLPAGWRQVAAFDTWPAPSLAELPVVCSPACLLAWAEREAEAWAETLQRPGSVLVRGSDQFASLEWRRCGAEAPDGGTGCDLPDDHVGDHKGASGRSWSQPRPLARLRCEHREEAAGVLGSCIRRAGHPGPCYLVPACGHEAAGSVLRRCARDERHPGRHTARDRDGVLWSWSYDDPEPRRVVADNPQG